MQNSFFGWAEFQIVAVLLLMLALPVGVVIYVAGLVRRMREEQTRLAERVASLESEKRPRP